MTQNTFQKPAEQSKGFDWSLLAFFALAYLIAWSLVPVLDNIAETSGLTPSALLDAVENGRWVEVASQLTVPTWLVFLLTRIQDFAFTIAGIIVALAFEGRAGLRRIANFPPF